MRTTDKVATRTVRTYVKHTPVVEILEVAKLDKRGEHITRQSALDRTNARACFCSPRSLRSQFDFRSKLAGFQPILAANLCDSRRRIDCHDVHILDDCLQDEKIFVRRLGVACISILGRRWRGLRAGAHRASVRSHPSVVVGLGSPSWQTAGSLRASRTHHLSVCFERPSGPEARRSHRQDV